MQSLDYDVCENDLWTQDQISRESSLVVRKDFARWMVFVVIGKQNCIQKEKIKLKTRTDVVFSHADFGFELLLLYVILPTF